MDFIDSLAFTLNSAYAQQCMIMMPTLIDVDVAAGIKQQTVKVMIQHDADIVAGKPQT